MGSTIIPNSPFIFFATFELVRITISDIPLTLSIAISNRVFPFKRGMSCLGLSSVDKGHNLSPLPPAIIKETIFIVGILRWGGKREH
jgi:hypothetical protein